MPVKSDGKAVCHDSCLTAGLSAASVTLNLRDCNESTECRSLELSVKYENLLDKYGTLGILILPIKKIVLLRDQMFQEVVQ